MDIDLVLRGRLSRSRGSPVCEEGRLDVGDSCRCGVRFVDVELSSALEERTEEVAL